MNEDVRPDPDALLADLRRHEAPGGRLHIFLGMCPGVGKTYAMLQAARRSMESGASVLVGIVETHGRSETAALVEGLDVLPRQRLDYRGTTVEEFDLDAALKRHPSIVLVDELAHTNAPGSRHLKRWQDVLELLDGGIDVFTTLNVQHIESQVDLVRQITGVRVEETVPDSLLDRAHEIQLIDLGVEKLLERLSEGRVYLGGRAADAAANFFKEGNLTALREMALRFTAEQVDRDLEDIRRSRRVSTPWKTNARLLVGVAPSPYADSLLRWTRRAAGRIGCPWLAVWVEGARPVGPEAQESLTRSLGLARKLGGEVVSATGENIAEVLLRVARERNVTQIVVGKPQRRTWWRRSLAEVLIDESGDIDVCVVRPLAGPDKARIRTAPAVPAATSLIGEYSWAAVLIFVLASVCGAVVSVTGYMFVALVFLVAVVGAALRLSRGPVLALAAVAALVWDYFFIPPTFTFHIEKLEDMIMFGMFFVVAISMGHLTARLRQREKAERQRQRQTAALLRVTQSAALSAEPEKGLAEALRTINDLLKSESALVVREGDRSLARSAHPASTFTPPAKEWGVITWSFQNKQPAGRFTDTLPQSHATWFPLQTATSIMGVLGVSLGDEATMDFGTRQTIEAFALQLALVLEKEHFIQAVSRAEVLEQSDRLRRTLLDSVSHELKTPLAVIQAALDGLRGTPNTYVDEIATANTRLRRVVENLLQMTRLESSVVEPLKDWCDLHDVIRSAREAAGEPLRRHFVSLNVAADLPVMRLDHTLLAQALANILHNAAIYSPADTPIEVAATIYGNQLTVRVRDHGPGLPPGMEERVFEKFQRGPGTPAGGTGLGLAIARGFMRAQGGDLRAHNHADGGAEFALTLPVDIFPA